MKILQKRFAIPLIIAIIIIIAGVWLYFQFGTSIFPPHPIDRLNNLTSRDIVSTVNEYIYKSSEKIDEYAKIRWGENGTFRNQDVPAFGIYISSDGNSLYPQYNETKEILEKNVFVKNDANSFGKFETPSESNGNFSREDTGYQNNNTICTVSISASENRNTSSVVYHLALKCGTLTSTLVSEDWKIYKNDEYGIRFEYPPTLTVSENQTVFQSGISSKVVALKNSDGTSSINDIQLWITPNQSSLDEYIGKMMKNTEYQTATNIVISGIPAKTLSLIGQLFAEGNQIFYVKNGYGYRWIAYKARDIDGGLDMIPILNGIVSTFEFAK